MTLRNFLAFCENYYGEKYDGVLLDVMQGYLDGHSSEFLDAAANVLIRRFSRTHRKAPGPAEIENNLDEISKMMRKPVCVPEAREKISEDERDLIINGFRELNAMLKSGKKRGPLSEILSETLDIEPEAPYGKI
jgi:hypothetical protein